MKFIGELKGKTQYKEIVKSPVISIDSVFKLELIYNDVPVTLFYKYKTNPWKSILVNNAFSPKAVPHNSDVYLSATLSSKERVIYEIDH